MGAAERVGGQGPQSRRLSLRDLLDRALPQIREED
jgi:hypothetical protein